MTLEEIKEAVEVIKAYRQMLTDSVSNQIDEDIKAFDMAVEAMERESCVDCISRQAVMDALCNECELFHRNGEQICSAKCEEYHFLATLPPVNPQRMGHWIFDEILDKHYYCSECKSMGVDYWDFCPNCGVRMIAPQAESEGKDG